MRAVLAPAVLRAVGDQCFDQPVCLFLLFRILPVKYYTDNVVFNCQLVGDSVVRDRRDVRISRIPTVNVPMKSSPASRVRFFVTSYWSIASSPEILLIGEKNRCAPLGSQSIHFSSSKLGTPRRVWARVCRTQYSLISSGKKNLAPGIAEKASLIKDQRRFRTGSGPWLIC